MATKIRLAAAALLSASTATNAAYNLVKDYSGQTFFDNWSYYGSYDNLTNGPSIFVRHSDQRQRQPWGLHIKSLVAH
jgi:hypothetical protein